MPTWAIIVGGIVAWALICELAEHFLDWELAEWSGKALGAAFVAACVFGVVYGALVLVLGHDPLGLGWDKPGPPEPCQQLPAVDPRAC